MPERLDRFWVGATAALLAVSIAGIVTFLVFRPNNGAPLALTRPEPQHYGQAYVSGAVVTPGIYALKSGDTVADLVAAAGGPTANAEKELVKLVVPEIGDTAQTQRVDLNSAETWLLEALPGIGPATANAIVEHRKQFGPFRTTKDLLRVPGIGEVTFQRVSGYVTVGE